MYLKPSLTLLIALTGTIAISSIASAQPVVRFHPVQVLPPRWNPYPVPPPHFTPHGPSVGGAVATPYAHGVPSLGGPQGSNLGRKTFAF